MGERLPIPDGWSLNAPKEPGVYRIAIRDGEVPHDTGPLGTSLWAQMHARLHRHDERGLWFTLEWAHPRREHGPLYFRGMCLKHQAVWGPRVPAPSPPPSGSEASDE